MKKPPELAQQAGDVAALARLAADFFAGKVAAAEARPARLTARRSARAALEALTGDWLAISRRLEEACEQTWLAVDEAARFESAHARFAEMSAELARAAAAVEGALGAPEAAAARDIVEAKKRAMEIERMHREVRRGAQDDPRFVAGLKTSAVALRLSEAAEAMQRAADALAERLGAAQ